MTIFRTSVRNFLAHKGRMALSAIAVVLSVAFVCGTLVFTDTMNTTFDKLFADTAADVTVSPKQAKGGEEVPATGKPETVPASAVTELRGTAGVQRAVGMAESMGVTIVDGDNNNLSPSTGAPTIAGNWNSESAKSMDITSGRAPRSAGEVMLDADTAEKHHLKVGDKLRTIAVTGDWTARISGIAAFQTTNPGAAIVFFDTATAQQKLLGSADAYSSIALTAEQGVSHEQLKKSVSEALGDDYKVATAAETSAENQNDIGSFLDVLKYALLGFAGIALLVGIFLIVNTFSMLVAQRTREIGLMRAIGSSRRQVNRSVLIEALLLGIVGSVVGVGLGVGLAVGLMKLMGQAGMKLSTADLTIKATTPVVGLALGIVVTVVAAYLPARRAGKISPMAALRDTGVPARSRTGRLRAVLGALLTLAGAAGLVAAGRADEAAEGSQYLALGILLSLIGFVALGPLLAGFVVRVLSAVLLRVFGSVGRLAERNALRNPRRTGATGAALMIGLALVASLSVVGSSMVASATEELDRTVGADFIVQSDSFQPINPQVEQKIRETPGLERVTDYKWVDVTLTTPDGWSAKEHLTAASPSYAEDVRVETVEGKLSDAYQKDGISVDEGFAKKHGLALGDRIGVAFTGGQTAQLRVKAITPDDRNVDRGSMYTSIETVRQYLPADRMPLNVLMFAKAEDGKSEQAFAALKSQLAEYPQYQARDQVEYKELLQDQIGQLLNMVYGLLALAIIVAVLGVVNTLALSVVERTREIGLMRAIGLSRRQLRRMIRLESVVIALFGALLGLGLGMGWGTAAQRLLALEGLEVLDIPWPTIIAVFAGSAVVGLVAALVPAYRAGRMNVLNAIATE
ncbi:ABC transporter permease [Streptomyces sp. TP-A0874]|uniref:ABC transporter permease n=1 Tax=Streptomyces sp. TP-A0874 TaxID=549819 RepID=UPI000852AD1E|nr:ABC transporter permease [Streptomyces sp. TP-A0874]